MVGGYDGLTVLELANRGNQWAGKLLARADVFLESAPPGTLTEHGLDYASVASNQGLIDASLTDFGQDGPWRDYVMFDPSP